MKSRRPLHHPALLLLFVLIGGCGQGEDKPVTTQVAAKVNATEITVSQINNVLARTQNVTPEAEQRVKREILDNLIDQQLARQQAVESKLDRTPNVLQKLEAAKSEVLARAYLEQIATDQPKVTPDEVKNYYNAHPDLFARRRIYNIEEISMPVQADLADALRDQAKQLRSMQDIAAWLRSRKIQFTANNGVRAAEQIPLEFLANMQTMKDGEIRVFELRGGLQVIRVLASQMVPVDETTAAPRIRQFLFSQSSNAAIAREMKQVKAKANIEYIGEFRVSAEDAEARAKLQLEARAGAEAAAKAKADAEAAVKAQARAAAGAEAQERADAMAKARLEAEQARREAEARSTTPAQRRPAAETIEKGARGL